MSKEARGVKQRPHIMDMSKVKIPRKYTEEEVKKLTAQARQDVLDEVELMFTTKAGEALTKLEDGETKEVGRILEEMESGVRNLTFK